MAMMMNGRSSASKMELASPYIPSYDPTTPWQAEHRTGTTIMAVEFDGGVIIGADSRSTTGVYIANRVTDKLTKITDNIYCCRSGSSADTQAVADVVRYHVGMHRMELGEEPRVEVAASLFQDMCYNYRDSITAGIILAGWDPYKGGQVYTIPLGGMQVRQKVATGGSGTITLAMLRDGSSGGCVRLGVITKDGCVKHCVLGNELPKFYMG
ncbi:hypothetical protein FOCC_FOCC011107 [Frankliniella occidentalis]|nr:hypothetical protein FOCC_FOCC011107 [Frankliniella occidentalis]